MQTASLKCPSCGNSVQLDSKAVQFGYEFTCKICNSTSVMISNNRLYIPNVGERICLKCGRVAEKEMRICQCGQPLVRKCIRCLKEFPVHYQICSYCGWDQNLASGSSSAVESEIQMQIRRLIDPDFEVRIEAASALGTIGKSAAVAVPNLIVALNDTDNNVRWTAASALGKIGSSAADAVPALAKLLGQARFAGYPVAAALAQIGAPAFPALVKALGDKDTFVRQEAVWGLENFGAIAVPALIETLNDASDIVRSSAVQALGKIGAPAASAVPALVRALANQSLGSNSYDYISVAINSIGPAAKPALQTIAVRFAKYPQNMKEYARTLLLSMGYKW